MSTQHSDDYYVGHGVGYEEAERDIAEWADETVAEWKALKIYTHEELWAAIELCRELERRASRRDA